MLGFNLIGGETVEKTVTARALQIGLATASGAMGGVPGCRIFAAALAIVMTYPSAALPMARPVSTGCVVLPRKRGTVNARDRIGQGPWHNVQGILVAQNVDELHGDDDNPNKQTVLTEQGEQVNGRGDGPNMHDILTGSKRLTQ